MPFKLNIGTKDGKSWKMELESEAFLDRKIGENIPGKEIKAELEGYEFLISGTSDNAGFPGKKDLEGAELKRVLLKKGFGFKNAKSFGLRKRKTLRGNTISQATMQINLKAVKEGPKKLSEIFPEQNQNKKSEEKKEEKKAEEKIEAGKSKQAEKTEKTKEVKEDKKEAPKAEIAEAKKDEKKEAEKK